MTKGETKRKVVGAREVGREEEGDKRKNDNDIWFDRWIDLNIKVKDSYEGREKKGVGERNRKSRGGR